MVTFLLGVMTDPTLIAWRGLLRDALRAQLSPADSTSPPRLRLRLLFVMGSVRDCAWRESFGCAHASHPLNCSALREEAARHADILVLARARECRRKGQAVAEKSFEWYRHAARRGGWVGKMDDDSMPRLARLAADVLRMDARVGGGFGYYGRMRWRLWNASHRLAAGVRPLDAVSSAAEGTAAFGRVARSRRREAGAGAREEHAGGVVGPFPYADGALHVMSAALAAAVFNGRHAAELSREWYEEGWVSPLADGAWNHEDVGLGYLVAAETHAQKAVTTYFSLRDHHVSSFASKHSWMSDPLKTGPQPATPPAKQKPAEVGPLVTFIHSVRNHRALVKSALALRQTAGTNELLADESDAFECLHCSQWGTGDAPQHSPFGPAERWPQRPYECCQKPRNGQPAFNLRGPEG
ncbi:hypothetical protein AB1Y20_007040 [Prymnesium parvum]|uniref:Hexosyltransferase n=1 Tax=Prymnesium parvum TaxID=97485 RepID=A0AB34IZS9_PRYPA